jgi:hypothetical protein
MEAFLIALPGLLFSLIITLPLALGTFAVVRHLRAGSRSKYLQNLAGSIAAGAVMLLLLWSSLFGDSLSKSSTAALILAIAPMYGAVAQGIAYFATMAILRKSPAQQPVSFLARVPMLVPVLMLAVLVAGLVKISMDGNDSDVAQKASNPQTLQLLLEKSRTGQADDFAIPFNLAQNPNAPAGMLTELATSEHATIRAHVASNPNTPDPVVETLRYDCASFVRKEVVARLGPKNAIEPPPALTGFCPKHWKKD